MSITHEQASEVESSIDKTWDTGAIIQKLAMKRLGVQVDTVPPDEASFDEFQTAFNTPLSESTREAMQVLFPGRKQQALGNALLSFLIETKVDVLLTPMVYDLGLVRLRRIQSRSKLILGQE